MNTVTQTDCLAWKLVSRPTTDVRADHFELSKVSLPELEKGEVLVRARFLSIEPLLRGRLMDRSSYAASVQLGEIMTGRALSEVVDSRSEEFKPGDIVEHWLGWREQAVVSASELRAVETGPWPISANLGVLGSSGLSAYLALTEIGQPQPGDTVLVTAASGAVGALVVQIAKKLGCRVIGVAGSPEKCRFVTSIGADATINYKTDDLDSAIREAAPDGINVFFDSVGGPIHDAAMSHLALHARVVIFGTMDFYANPDRPDIGPRHLRTILVKRAMLRGFLIRDFDDKVPEARAQLAAWWRDGELTAREDIRLGFEKAPQALADVIAGRAQGKVLVEVA
ncbi:NADP-dependent oxidoreductase [Henriciella litoralis]|uniref:NADP-dependent oxidoreductase n=1 Tax=Henriciella litoralis TaxID=568102 RepID=UPI000A00C365|nr:NADP-dependent oxidoreductase [Henriciella litoralis]